MNELMNVGGAGAPLTMTSHEIADLTGKEHRNVMRDIRVMLVELHGEDRLLSFEQTVTRPNPSGGAPIPSTAYALPKRETLILVSGYSVAMRAKIIDRWQELEAQASDPMRVLNDPAAMRGLLLGYTERVLELEHKVEVLAPKAEALDRIATGTDGSFCLTDAAKALQVPPKKFLSKLNQMGWIHRRPMGSGWLGYEHRIKQGVIEHKVTTGEKSDGAEWISTQARVTAKGMARLAQIFTSDQS